MKQKYDNLFMGFTGEYLIIRYNSNKYIDKYNKSKHPYFKSRINVLEYVINKHINRIENDENNELLEIDNVFYDEI